MLDEVARPTAVNILQQLLVAEDQEPIPIPSINFPPQQYQVPVSLESNNELFDWNPYTFHLQPTEQQRQSTNSGASSSSQAKNSGTTKPARKYYKGPPVCQACNCDLKNLKEYYRRYRVCDKCQKADCVEIDGEHMRYCQQCGRFQQLKDFNGTRRSCRERLELHNARRRKNQPTPNVQNHNQNNSNNINNINNNNNVQNLGISSGGIQAQIQPLLNPNVQMMSDPAVLAFERKPENAVAFSGFGNPSVQMLLNDTPLRLSKSRDSAGSAYMNMSDENNNINKSKNFDLNLLPSVSDIQVPIPETQLQMSDFFAEDFANVENPLPTSAGNNLQNLQHQQNAINVNTSSQMHALQNQNQNLNQFQQAANIDPTDEFMLELEQVLGSNSLPSVTLNKNLQLESENQPGAGFLSFPENFRYDGFNKLCNLTMKLFEMGPHQIPWGLKEHLHAAINMGIVVEAFLRPGCIHFSADGIVSSSQFEETTAEEVAERLLAQGVLNIQNATMLIHLNGTQVLIRNGQIIQDEGIEEDAIILLEVDKVVARKGDEITINGNNLQGTELLVRQNGEYFDYEIIDQSNTFFKIKIPEDTQIGLLKFQAQSGPNFSQVLTCTIANSEIFAEIQTLSKSEQIAMSIDLGLVLELSDHIHGKLILGNHGRRLYSVDDVKNLVPIARSLFGYSVLKGFSALANSTILPASTCCYSGSQFSDAIAWTTTNNLPLLFMAVQSRKADIIGVLSSWCSWLGYVDDRAFNLWVVAGVHQLTALHLSALLDDEGEMATALVDLCPEGMDVMRNAKTREGLNPFEFALQYGSEGVRRAFSRLIQRESALNNNSNSSLGRHDTAHMSRTITSISEDTSLSPFEGQSVQGESMVPEEDDDADMRDMHDEDDEHEFGETLRISSARRNADVIADSATQIELRATKSKSMEDTTAQT